MSLLISLPSLLLLLSNTFCSNATPTIATINVNATLIYTSGHPANTSDNKYDDGDDGDGDNDNDNDDGDNYDDDDNDDDMIIW